MKHLTQIAEYVTLLDEANQRINLVSRKLTSEQILELAATFSDALEVADVAPEGRLLDVGSGGGLPGIPLAIRYPKLRVFLNESRKLRVIELRQFVAQLGLKNAQVLEGRIETLHQEAQSISPNIVTAFGVAKADVVMDIVCPLLADNGVALLSIPAEPTKEQIAVWVLRAAMHECSANIVERELAGGRKLLRLHKSG